MIQTHLKAVIVTLGAIVLLLSGHVSVPPSNPIGAVVVKPLTKKFLNSRKSADYRGTFTFICDAEVSLLLDMEANGAYISQSDYLNDNGDIVQTEFSIDIYGDLIDSETAMKNLAFVKGGTPICIASKTPTSTGALPNDLTIPQK